MRRSCPGRQKSFHFHRRLTFDRPFWIASQSRLADELILFIFHRGVCVCLRVSLFLYRSIFWPCPDGPYRAVTWSEIRSWLGGQWAVKLRVTTMLPKGVWLCFIFTDEPLIIHSVTACLSASNEGRHDIRSGEGATLGRTLRGPESEHSHLLCSNKTKWIIETVHISSQ